MTVDPRTLIPVVNEELKPGSTSDDLAEAERREREGTGKSDTGRSKGEDRRRNEPESLEE